MKRSIILMSFLGVLLSLYAEPINRERAKEIARTFVQQKNRSISSANETKYHELETSGKDTLLYLFEIENNKGYVIVSGDSRTNLILAYSFSSSLGDINNLHPGFIEIINGYKAYIKEVQQQPSDLRSAEVLRADVPTIVKGPLLKTVWGQTYPYNTFCPANSLLGTGKTGNAVTGCTATAMAQIMKYWSYPEKGTGSNSYTPASNPAYGVQSVNFENEYYDWDKMPDDPTLNELADEAAKLMYHCGVSINMNYTPGESSGSIDNAADALKNYFGYSSSKRYTKNQVGDQEWIDLLKAELDANRPVLYNGWNQQNTGHAFVCDGYDSENRFHINYGWFGSSDGFFTLENSQFIYNVFMQTSIYPAVELLSMPYEQIQENRFILNGFSGIPANSFRSIRFELYKGDDEIPYMIDATITELSQGQGFNIKSDEVTIAYNMPYRYRLVGEKSDNSIAYSSFKKLDAVYKFVNTDDWIVQPSGVTNNLNDIFMVNENVGYIACSGGLILKTTNGGENWQQLASGMPENISDIHFFNENEGLMLIERNYPFGAEIYKTTNGGISWNIFYASGSGLYGYGYKMLVESETKIWINYDWDGYGTIFLYDGNSRSRSLYKNTLGISAICKPNEDIMIVANYGYNLSYTMDDGQTWQDLQDFVDRTVYYPVSFSGVDSYPGTNYAIVCGSKGELWFADFTEPSTDGSTYGQYILNGQYTSTKVTQEDLKCVAFSTPTTAYVFGENGTILKTSDKGKNLGIVPAITSATLKAATFPSAKNGWAVGDNGTILHCRSYSMDAIRKAVLIGKQQGSNTTFDIDTDMPNWDIESEVSWLKVIKNTSNNTVYVEALSENTTNSVRKGIIYVTGINGEKMELTVNQLTANYSAINDVNANIAETIVYPNPASGKFYVRVNSSFDDAQIKLYDISGKVVYEGKFSFEKDIEKEIILTKRVSGLHCLIIQDPVNNRIYKQKIILK